MGSLERPRLVLRVAVAGNRKIDETELDCLTKRLKSVFEALEDALLQFGTPERVPDLSRLYSSEKPTLRLLTGLADGVDQIAPELWLEKENAAVRRQLFAVLAAKVGDFRDNSSVQDKARFATLLPQNPTRVIELDGDFTETGSPDGNASMLRAFRGQASYLLHNCDLLIAAADQNAIGKPGGTLETVERAFDLGLPVLFLPIGHCEVHFSRSPADLAPGLQSGAAWKEGLENWLESLLFFPRSKPGEVQPKSGDFQHMDEFFSGEAPPSKWWDGYWEWFQGRFRAKPVSSSQRMPDQCEGNAEPKAVEEDASCKGERAFECWYTWADRLSGSYNKLYRGAFLLNFTLAFLAVSLAIVSLCLLIFAAEVPTSEAHSWKVWLASFAVIKLLVLIQIVLTTHQANKGRWNDKAIDFRYLAERLRSMRYLPALGSFAPPVPANNRYAARVLAQSAVDRLFHALVRQEEPCPPVFVRGLWRLQNDWLHKQVDYHQRNSAKMGAMEKSLKTCSELAAMSVIAIIAVDLLIVTAEVTESIPDFFHHPAEVLAVFLIAVAATLPAFVSSLNGLRAQAESAKLRDRSSQLAKIFEDLERRAQCLRERFPTGPSCGKAIPGAATLDALRLADDCARVTADEVSEWSVLYWNEVEHV